jgi:uncharacterized membrane protein
MADKSREPPITPEQDEPADEAAWTYRGYHLKTGEFVTAMVHLFRAEIQRANVWRQRLDTTTNWAVIATGAALSIAFSQPNVHHGVIILNTFLVTWFLYIEARRYRYYELWSYRIRLMETDFYAAMLVPPFHPSPEWAESLAESLLSPSFPISMWEAFGRRLRRNYLWILIILGASWIGKSYLFPQPVTSLAEFITRCAIGPIPGNIVIGLGIVYYCSMVLVAIATLGMTEATGEILSRFGAGSEHIEHAKPGSIKSAISRLAPSHRRNQLLALIITDLPEKVSSRLLTDLKRGVTSMQGKGMYTGNDRSILLCALTVTEVHNLKAIVAKEDPQAFVIVSPTHEILGRGFTPLDEK